MQTNINNNVSRNRAVLTSLGRPVYIAMVLLVLVSFECQNWKHFLTFLWFIAIGIGSAYVFLWNNEQVPNILTHLPIQSARKDINTESKDICVTCGKFNCIRHRELPKLEEFQPWRNIKIPSAVNTALLKFIDEVLERYVHIWYRKNWSNEACVDTLKLGIRYTAAKVLRRAQKVNIPELVLNKLLKDITAHLHVYLSAREKAPKEATLEEIEAAVIQEYGGSLHKAIRGEGTEQQYMQHLLECVMPHLIPADAVQSKLIKKLLQQLLTDNILLLGMNYVTKPDFINKFMLLLLDRDSRMLKTEHPTPNVVLLTGIVTPSCTTASKLKLSTTDILQKQEYLYIFMNFMKANGAVNVLQAYLMLNDLVFKLPSVIDEYKASRFMDEVTDLYKTYLVETTTDRVLADDEFTKPITKALQFSTPMEQVEALRKSDVLSRLNDVVYNFIDSVFCPLFHESEEFYIMVYGERSPATISLKQQSTQLQKEVRSSSRRKIDSRISKMYSLDKNPLMEQDIPRSASPFESIEVDDSEILSTAGYIPQLVKVIDAQPEGGIIPRFTSYTIKSVCVKNEGSSMDTKNIVIKRRYKEFLVLDSKLKQFYDDVETVPPKKTDQLKTELDQYLNDLLKQKKIQNSELFGAFLMGSADPSLFSPESVGGKMIKITKSFKTERGQNLDLFLQTLLDASITPKDPPSQEMEDEINEMTKKHCAIANKHQERLEGDANLLLDFPQKKVSPPAIRGIFDIIMYLAQNLYKVTPTVSCILIGLKILGQHTIESFILNFFSNKVDLLVDERQVVMVIRLLHDNLFYDGPQRTAKDVLERQEELKRKMLQYPPELLIRIIGKDKFSTGTELIHEGLQSHILNKQMVYTLLDTILIEAFPELKDLST